jgi:hypothetical protein
LPALFTSALKSYLFAGVISLPNWRAVCERKTPFPVAKVNIIDKNKKSQGFYFALPIAYSIPPSKCPKYNGSA